MPVYLIRAGECGPVKIGFTARPLWMRLAKMQTDNHERLSVLRLLQGGENVEVHLHARFVSFRIRGDWFRFSDVMLGDLGFPDEPEPERNGALSRSSTALGRHLFNEGITVPAFAGEIGVSVQAVHRYVAGERTPHRRVMERITTVTGGKVQPNDFFARAEAAA